MERHIQTIIGGLILAAMVWVFNAVNEVQITGARQTEQIIALGDKIAVLTAFSSDRYTSTDAERDLRIRDNQITDLIGRVRDLEDNSE